MNLLMGKDGAWSLLSIFYGKPKCVHVRACNYGMPAFFGGHVCMRVYYAAAIIEATKCSYAFGDMYVDIYANTVSLSASEFNLPLSECSNDDQRRLHK